MDNLNQPPDVKVDRREHPRLLFHCPVFISGIDGVGRIIDISLGGVYISLAGAMSLPNGQQIELRMKLPTEDQALRVKGKIITTTQQGLRCMFVDLTTKQKEAIAYCFDTFRDTLPIE